MLLITLAILLLSGGRAANDISVLEKLPDHDYVAEIRNLMQHHRWGEAQTLCEDVIALELPCAAEIPALQAQCRRESGKISSRLYKAGKGFITGAPDNSLEELGGSVVSDMLMYGDIRDLAKQGWYKITGKETDPVIASLAALGLLTEFVDIADWAPAALKAFRKVGAMTDSMGKYILKMSADILKTKKIDPAAKAFFGNLKNMLNSSGFIRSGRMIKYADNADDIALLAKSAAKNPHAAHLVARAADKRTCEIIKAVNKHPDSPALMKKIAQKGAGSLKLISRTGKILYKRHLAQFLRILMGKYFYLLCIALALGGGFLIYRALKNIKTILPHSRKTAA